jgi:integration host factor subunit alpha
MTALTKANIADFLSSEIGLNKREAKTLIDQFFEEIRLALETGFQVKISGFGSFLLRDKRERPGRNPKTGQLVPVSARRVVTFKASQKLKTLVEAAVGMQGQPETA